MKKIARILWNSFLMALQELRVNKLRTFLSLFGVTIGIFCIIGVLSLVDSLQNYIKSNLDAFGSNMIGISKWEWMNTNDYPWWKFVNRPVPKYSEYEFLKANAHNAETMYYVNQTETTVRYQNNTFTAEIYGTSEEMPQVQTIDLAEGRFITSSEYQSGTPVCVIGYETATQLFGTPKTAVGKKINIGNDKATVIGLIQKQGSNISLFFQYDYSVLLSYRYYASMYNVDKQDPVIFVKGKAGIPNDLVIGELRALMRQVRRLSPVQDDNFALNDVDFLKAQIYDTLSVLNIAGWIISGLSLLVGGFGIANIMFVTVRERRSQIGLKKAIGARSSTILSEFLIESAFLCIIGGVIGLAFVWILTLILSPLISFPIFISGQIVVLAFGICVALGVVAGIIPALVAARLNPVVAIRSN